MVDFRRMADDLASMFYEGSEGFDLIDLRKYENVLAQLRQLAEEAQTNRPVVEIPSDVSRREDMSPEGKLTLHVQPDGDVVLSIWGKDAGSEYHMVSAEFCTIGGGGGMSPRTLEALKGLMAAMDADNKAEARSRIDLRDYESKVVYQVKRDQE